MTSISDNLLALAGVKGDIRGAIEGHGADLTGVPFTGYAEEIESLEVGGGGESPGGGGDTEIPFRSRLTVPGDTDPWHLTSLTATRVLTYAFYADKLLTSVSLPAATSLGTYAFQSCSSLTSADFPLATSIGNNAFYQCSALTTADFPAATSIGTNAFYQCSALTGMDSPAVTRIGNNAFYYCTALTTTDFSSATSIGSYAFASCSALTSLTLSNNQVATLSNTNAFQSTPIADGTGYVYVPDDLVDQYKTATNWATYANQIMPLSQKP